MASVPPEYQPANAVEIRSRLLSGNLFASASVLLWAAGFPAAELLLEDWHPLVLMPLRLSMALAILLPLWLIVDGVDAMTRVRWRTAFWIGFLGFGTGTNLLLFAQWFTDPVTVALIATTAPISATIIEILARHRRIGPRFLAGLTASVLGGAIAVGQSISLDLGIGVLMAIFAGFCFAWASHRAVYALPDLTALGRSAITFVGAGVFTLLVFLAAWILGAVALPDSISPRQFGLLSIYSIAAMALSQILFIASVGRLGIALSSFHMNLSPFYVMIFVFALGGGWDWRVALGAAIVGFGVLLAQRAR